MNPRASIATTLSTLPRPKWTTIRSMIVENAIGSRQDRRDVLEDDAGLGEVGDVADQRLDLLDLHGSPPLALGRGLRRLLRRARRSAFGRSRVRLPSRAVAAAAAAVGGGRRPPRPARARRGRGCGPERAARVLADQHEDRRRDEDRREAPIATPTNIANAKSFSVSPPNSSRDRIGSRTTRDVFTDRINPGSGTGSTTPRTRDGRRGRRLGVLLDLVVDHHGVVEREPQDREDRDHRLRGDLAPGERVHPRR